MRGQDKNHSPSPYSSPVEGGEVNNFRVGFLLRASLRLRRRFWPVHKDISSRVSLWLSACMVFGFSAIVGCQQKMADQPRYEPLAKSDFFGDDRSARPLVEGTVARGQLKSDEALYTGKVNGRLTETLPFPVSKDILLRGRERFDIFCSPCHDRIGTGQGMVVKRGFRPPPSFHIDRLRTAPAGYFFDVITHGFGIMPDYAAQVSPKDRWAIVAYIRALQLSQNAKLTDVSEAERRSLETKP